MYFKTGCHLLGAFTIGLRAPFQPAVPHFYDRPCFFCRRVTAPYLRSFEHVLVVGGDHWNPRGYHRWPWRSPGKQSRCFGSSSVNWSCTLVVSDMVYRLWCHGLSSDALYDRAQRQYFAGFELCQNVRVAGEVTCMQLKAHQLTI